MTVGSLVALVVIVVVLIALLIPVPGWVPLVLIAALAVAILFGGVALPWRSA